ncbi:nitroreductase family protein [Streptomyces albogriseolus]|uniref:nitroreductase family protein n=1 Tax=Streptomyces albogriseolus TaxID=1887 RepID=UPI00379CA7A2
MPPHTATTAAAVHPLLADRWSPRSFDAGHTLGDEELVSPLEAARWVPSAHNAQPWRFLVGVRPLSVVAVGALTPADPLPPTLRERETAGHAPAAPDRPVWWPSFLPDPA